MVFIFIYTFLFKILISGYLLHINSFVCKQRRMRAPIIVYVYRFNACGISSLHGSVTQCLDTSANFVIIPKTVNAFTAFSVLIQYADKRIGQLHRMYDDLFLGGVIL